MIDAYSILYSSKARDDLKDIYSYIAHDLQVPDTAKGQVERIQREIQSLDFMPSRYSVVDWEPWKSLGMRHVPVDNYIVYYFVDDKRHVVTVMRIFYSGRDVENTTNFLGV